jgi:phosphatidylethanolamine-binding protein (PEBP) family uncharacterized protein
MTRDRKKHFLATIHKTIQELTQANQRMTLVLQKVVDTQQQQQQQQQQHAAIGGGDKSPPQGVTPVSSPETFAVVSSPQEIPPLPYGLFAILP